MRLILSTALRNLRFRAELRLGVITITLRMLKDADQQHIERKISVSGALDAEQQQKLLEIADKTPVTKALATGVRAARGNFIMAVAGDGAHLLADPAFVEKALRIFARTEVVVLVDAGDPLIPASRVVDLHQSSTPTVGPLLDSARVRALPPLGVAWRQVPAERLGDLTLAGRADDVLARLATHLRPLIVEWRQHPASPPRRAVTAPGPPARRDGGQPPPQVIRFAPRPSAAERQERKVRLTRAILLPGMPADERPDWYVKSTWRPPLSQRLFRYVEMATGRRIISLLITPPPGAVLEYELGAINQFSLRGTVRLVADPDGGFRASSPAEDADPETTLGYLEEVAFEGLDPIHLALPHGSDVVTLVGGADDPLRGSAEIGAFLGRIEPTPIRPRKRVANQLELALATVRDCTRDVAGIREQLDLTHRHAALLEQRLERLEASLPARVYRRVRDLRRRALAVRMLGRRDRH